MLIRDKIRIADFGTSKILKRKGSKNNTKTEKRGTPNYLPPEILKSLDDNDQISPSSSQDIWSLGIIAHQIFSNGKHPFKLLNSESSITSNIEKEKYQMDPLIPIDSPIYQIIQGILFINNTYYYQ